MQRANKAANVNTDRTVSAIFKRSLALGSSWEEKDDFLDVIYWMRQLFALVNGLVWGLVPFHGIIAIAGFFLINCAIVYLYSTKYQQVDDEDYGGPMEILKEGLFTAFSVFVVTWIMTYTALHPKPLF